MTGNVGPGWVLRAVLVAVAVVFLAPGLLTLAGGFLPDVPLVARLGALLNDGLAWVWLSVLGAVMFSALAVAKGGRRGTPILLAISLAASGGAGLVTWRYQEFARAHGASFDLLRGVGVPTTSSTADATLTFATIDGVHLHAAIWRPPAGVVRSGRAVVYVHGGAFVAGGLGMRPGLFSSLAAGGTVVVDVEYRLAPPPRWQDAPGDVLCALAWLRTVAVAEAIDPARVVVMGESAGGSLALLAAYAAGTDQLNPSCPGDPIVPVGVMAVAPAADLAGIWQDGTLTAADARFPEAYVGGPPGQYPDRYALASPFRLMRGGLPPTLLLTGANDHLVRLARVQAIADALVEVGADVQMLVAPFVDHGFDGSPDGFGAQVEVQIVQAFLAQVAG